MGKMDDDGSLGAEVSSRLDELFGDDDAEDTPVSAAGSETAGSAGDAPARSVKKSASAAGPKPVAEPDTDSPIGNLKALVFSIDWEITDETMVDFLTETKKLQQQYKNDQILSLFLKLHESIGKYIKAKKARAHPDAIKFVASVYKSFEKVLLSPRMQQNQKKQLLSAEVKKFKDFKQRVLLRDESAGPAAVAVETTAPAGALPQLSPESREMADYIVEQIKKEIKAEFHTMRQILKNLGA